MISLNTKIFRVKHIDYILSYTFANIFRLMIVELIVIALYEKIYSSIIAINTNLQ